MFQHRPEQLFGHPRIAHFVGMRESVATGRTGTPKRREGATEQPQGIADVIESDAVSELGKKQGDDMAPGFEGAGLFVDTVLAGQLRDHVVGNQIANLTQN